MELNHVWPWRNVNLLSANMSILNHSLQKGLANVAIFRRDGWPNLAEWGLCTPIGMPTNGYHGDTDEMLRRQPPAYSVQASFPDSLLSCHTHGLTL